MRPLTMALALTTVMAVSAPSWAKNDKAFLREAMQGNLAEISLGQLAQSRALNSDVKTYGDTLAKDHAEANAKVIALAQQMNVKVPTRPSFKQRVMARRMERYSKTSFDSRFVDHMIKDHQKDIADYNKETKVKGQVADLAKAMLPTLQKHLDMAQALKPKVMSSNMRAKTVNSKTTTGSSSVNSPSVTAPPASTVPQPSTTPTPADRSASPSPMPSK